MEVILLESIEGLGRKGAVVKVKRGFGRNYLLPRQKAMVASADNLFRLQRLKKKFDAEEAQLLAEIREIAAQLENVSVTLTEKATAEGHLFGSVTPAMICRQLAEQGMQVAERTIRLSEPIKAVGTYPVIVHLHPEVDVPVNVVVDAEGGLATEPEATEPEAEAAKAESTDSAGDSAGAAEESTESAAGES